MANYQHDPPQQVPLISQQTETLIIPTLSYQQHSTTAASFLNFQQNQHDLIQGNTFSLNSNQTSKSLDFKEMLFKGDNNLYRN
ncbi:4298_t:CDS:1, partial [Acaulospora morrowiae]